jgi:hypothetical protein
MWTHDFIDLICHVYCFDPANCQASFLVRSGFTCLSCSVIQVYKKSKWELDASEVRLGRLTFFFFFFSFLQFTLVYESMLYHCVHVDVSSCDFFS